MSLLKKKQYFCHLHFLLHMNYPKSQIVPKEIYKKSIRFKINVWEVIRIDILLIYYVSKINLIFIHIWDGQWKVLNL